MQERNGVEKWEGCTLRGKEEGGEWWCRGEGVGMSRIGNDQCGCESELTVGEKENARLKQWFRRATRSAQRTVMVGVEAGVRRQQRVCAARGACRRQAGGGRVLVPVSDWTGCAAVVSPDRLHAFVARCASAVYRPACSESGQTVQTAWCAVASVQTLASALPDSPGWPLVFMISISSSLAFVTPQRPWPPKPSHFLVGSCLLLRYHGIT